jgi:hypothetical protein
MTKSAAEDPQQCLDLDRLRAQYAARRAHLIA